MKINTEHITVSGKPSTLMRSYTRDREMTSVFLGVQEIEGGEEDEEQQYECVYVSIVSPTHLTAIELVRSIFEQGLGEYLIGDSLKDIAAAFGITTYGGLVSLLVRAKYTADDVEAILLNKDDGDIEHQREYDELQNWRKEAKQIAKKL